MNDADRFIWIAEHLQSIQYGILSMGLTYVDGDGGQKYFNFNYLENDIPDISQVGDSELLRKVIDQIVNQNKTS
jgi:hypothetical protein